MCRAACRTTTWSRRTCLPATGRTTARQGRRSATGRDTAWETGAGGRSERSSHGRLSNPKSLPRVSISLTTARIDETSRVGRTE
ncbi:hypothetical protein NSERUTF1_5192 [Nocardia seriolae]|nr:hypothetical protein NSERUTF1_5192 [Nocardia seriolae]